MFLHFTINSLAPFLTECVLALRSSKIKVVLSEHSLVKREGFEQVFNVTRIFFNNYWYQTFNNDIMLMLVSKNNSIYLKWMIQYVVLHTTIHTIRHTNTHTRTSLNFHKAVNGLITLPVWNFGLSYSWKSQQG